MTDNVARLSTKPDRSAGFTLIEVMIVVAIIALLATIALPSYRDYVRRGKIPEGTAALANARVQFEQCFQDSAPHEYTNCTCPGDTSNFTIDCGTPDATTYTITATGKSSKGMGDFTYTINQANDKATTSVPSGWASNSSCWVIRKDGSC
jgi:type IV pilus assembly protein PilE